MPVIQTQNLNPSAGNVGHQAVAGRVVLNGPASFEVALRASARGLPSREVVAGEACFVRAGRAVLSVNHVVDKAAAVGAVAGNAGCGRGGRV